MSSRIFIGHLSSRASERDIEHFFRGYGRIRDIVLKNGFGFVQFDDERDASDAIYELNGKDLAGERVILEPSRRGPRDRGYEDRDRYGGGRSGGRDRDYDRGGPRRGGNSRFGPPTQTRHRMIVENLSTSVSWQDLKDMMRNAGEVTYADAHRTRRNEAIVCFATRDDLLRALDKYQGKEVNGRELKLIDDSDKNSRSRSRSASRSRSRKRSRSRDRSRSRSPRSSKSASRSRSRSASRDNGSRSKSGTPEKKENGRGDESN